MNEEKKKELKIISTGNYSSEGITLKFNKKFCLHKYVVDGDGGISTDEWWLSWDKLSEIINNGRRCRMKTAIELFRDYATSTLSGVESKLMNLKMFREALTEDRKEITDKIEFKIKRWKLSQERAIEEDKRVEEEVANFVLAELTELLTFIKEK